MNDSGAGPNSVRSYVEGMRRVRQFVRIPTATNTVVVNFEQLAAGGTLRERRRRSERARQYQESNEFHPVLLWPENFAGEV